MSIYDLGNFARIRGKGKPRMCYDFEEYIREGDAAQREKARAWQTAIGLQAVDDLQVSDYHITWV